MTKQKRLVLDVAASHRDHPSADRIFLEVKDIDGRISRATVYRNLEQLSASGELLHVRVPGADRYDSRTEFHYHMVCVRCGAVCDAPVAYRREQDREAEEASGFLVYRHRTFFEGLCPDCRGSSL